MINKLCTKCSTPHVPKAVVCMKCKASLREEYRSQCDWCDKVFERGETHQCIAYKSKGCLSTLEEVAKAYNETGSIDDSPYLEKVCDKIPRLKEKWDEDGPGSGFTNFLQERIDMHDPEKWEA